MSFAENKSYKNGNRLASTAAEQAVQPAFKLDLIRSLRMHPVLASSVAAVSLVLLLLYASLTKPVYDAEAIVYEQPETSKLLDQSLTSVFDSGRYDSFLQEQIQAIQRPETISAALGKLPGSTWAEYGSLEQTAVPEILARLKVARVTTTYQLALNLNGSDPKKASDLLNAIASAYLNSAHQQTQTTTKQRVSLLSEERHRVAGELRIAETEQSALGASLGVANPNGDGDPYGSELTSIREQLVQARTAHDAVAAQLASFNGQQQGYRSALAAAGDEVIVGDPALASLRSSVGERRAALHGQMAGMTAENPLRQRYQEELADGDRSLDETTAKLHAKAEHELLDKVKADLQRTGDVESRLNARLSERVAAAVESTPKLQRAAELNVDLKRLLLRQATIDDASRTLELEADRPETARLISPAQVSSSAGHSRKRLLLASAFPLALLFGALAAAIARKCDQRIYVGSDVQKALGFLPLAILPARDEVPKAIRDAYVFRLAGGIESIYRSKGARTFLLTPVSSQTEIGPLIQLLPQIFTQMGVDVTRTTTAELLLAMQGERTIEDATPERIDATQTFLSPAENHGFVNAKLSLLQEHNKLVLIEASPLVDSAETEYVARCAHATLLVAECAVTTRAELVQAAELLQRLNVSGVAVVFEGMQRRFTELETRGWSSVSETHERVAQGTVKVGTQASTLSVDLAHRPAQIGTMVLSESGKQASQGSDSQEAGSSEKEAPSSSPAQTRPTLTSSGSLVIAEWEEGELKESRDILVSEPLTTSATTSSPGRLILTDPAEEIESDFPEKLSDRALDGSETGSNFAERERSRLSSQDSLSQEFVPDELVPTRSETVDETDLLAGLESHLTRTAPVYLQEIRQSRENIQALNVKSAHFAENKSTESADSPERDGMLTHPWGLLSRFQQASFPPARDASCLVKPRNQHESI